MQERKSASQAVLGRMQLTLKELRVFFFFVCVFVDCSNEYFEK